MWPLTTLLDDPPATVAASLVGTPDATATASATTASVNLPAGIAAGDIGVAGVVYNQTNGDPTVTSGWTQVSEVSFSASMRCRYYTRTMDGSESGTLTFTHPSANKMAAAAAVLRGVTGTPALVTNSAGNDTNPTASVSASSVAVSIWFERGGTVPTSMTSGPSGFTVHDSAFGTGGGQTCASIASNLTPSASSVGGGSWTPNVSNSGTVTATFALEEAAVGFTGSASLSGAGTLTAAGVGAMPGAASLSGSGTLTATGTPALSRSAALSGSGSLSAATPSPVTNLTYPIYIAHRGGANITDRAENTTTAYALSIANDHPSTLLEGDCAGLATGGGYTAEERIALTHDGDDLSTNSRVREADGTTVVTGTSITKTVAQWDTYLITQRTGIAGGPKPASRWYTGDGGNPGLADLLLANPSKVAMPEVKEPEALTPLIDSITARGLIGQTIVQSFDYTEAQTIAAAGLNALFLTNSFTSPTAAAIYAAGIRWVGVDRTIGDLAGYCTTAHAAGLKVITYTVNSTVNQDAALAAGVDGMFTDRPDLVNAGPHANVNLTGTGTLTASGSPATSRAVALSGAGSLAATGAPSFARSTALTGSGTLTATGSPAALGVTALTGAGTLTAAGSPAATRTVTLTGAGTLTATATTATSTTASLAGSGTLAATGSGSEAGTVTAALSGSGSLTATGRASTAGAATLAGAGSLTATGRAGTSTTVNLAGVGTLVAVGIPALAAHAELAGMGVLSALGAEPISWAPSPDRTSTVTAANRLSIVPATARTSTVRASSRISTVSRRA